MHLKTLLVIAFRQFKSFCSKSQFIFWMLPKNPSKTLHFIVLSLQQWKSGSAKLGTIYYQYLFWVLTQKPISIDSNQQKFDHWIFILAYIIIVRSVFSKVNQSLTDSFCSWGWCHQSCMVMLMLTMRIEETVSQVVRRCNPDYWMPIYWIQKYVQSYMQFFFEITITLISNNFFPPEISWSSFPSHIFCQKVS